MACRSKGSTAVWVFCLSAALLAAAILPVSGHCAPLRFIFMADSRGQNDGDNIINKPVLKAINDQILALPKRPSFVIHGGDQSRRGYARGKYIFKEFKDEMKPLTDAGIKLYAVMGNHELYRDDGSDVENEEVGNLYPRLCHSLGSPANKWFSGVPRWKFLPQGFFSFSLWFSSIDIPILL